MSKRRRLDRDGPSYASTGDVLSVLTRCSTRSASSRSSAFSPTANLIALASSSPFAIDLTYLSVPRFNVRLQVPVRETVERLEIKLLSFSPDGAYLLCVSGSTSPDCDGTDDYLTVYEHADEGSIDIWSRVLHEQAASFGARLAHDQDGNQVVSVRWVGEPRAWFPATDSPDSPDSDSRRAFSCAPPRSSPLSGAAFVAVLSSDEIVFVHLPRTSPLLPNVVCMPLHPPPASLSPPPAESAPLPPATGSSPSRRALSLTAVPTPTTTSIVDPALSLVAATPNRAAATHATPTAHISNLVGSLVSALPALDSSLPLPIAPSPAAGAGNAALKEELRAAQLATSSGRELPTGTGSVSSPASARRKRKRRIRLADVGAVRGTTPATTEAGLTTFLVATVVTTRSSSRPRQPRMPPPSPPSATTDAIVKVETAAKDTTAAFSSDLGIGMNLDDEHYDLAALDGFDFGSLDAAFGSTKVDVNATTKADPAMAGVGNASASPEKLGAGGPEESPDVKEWDEWESATSESQDDEAGRAEWRIELSEITVDMLNVDGPRLTVKPQPHFFASPPEPSGNCVDRDQVGNHRPIGVTHLAFLEDTLSAPTSSGLQNIGSESAVDLRLLVVSASAAPLPRSTLSTYAFSNEPYELSEAFSHLECRKAEVRNVDIGEWSTRFAMETQLGDSTVLTALSSRPMGRDYGTFVVVVADPVVPSQGTDTGITASTCWRSRIVALDCETLAPHEPETQTFLPERDLYSSILLSPNATVAACLPHAVSRGLGRPVIAASPYARDSPNRLALSLIRQTDASDIIGVAASAWSLDHARQLLDETHSLVQAQLGSDRPVCDTSIQFDLLGVASALYRDPTSPPRAPGTDATVRVDVAQGLVECAAAVRAFAKVERKERGGGGGNDSNVSYRCETDALWPLVGHAAWYREFIERLIRDVLSAPPEPPTPLLLHFLHPVARGLHNRLSTSLVGLAATLKTLAANGAAESGGATTMGAAELEMIDLASKVLEDTVVHAAAGRGRGEGVGVGAGGGFAHWKRLLDQVEAEVEGLDQGIAFGSSLSTVTVPETFRPQSTSVLSLIRHAYPPTTTTTTTTTESTASSQQRPTRGENDSTTTWDAIRKCRLVDAVSAESTTTTTTNMMQKQCLRCGNKSGAVGPTTTMTSSSPTGAWAAFEEGWRSRCACGGLWRRV